MEKAKEFIEKEAKKCSEKQGTNIESERIKIYAQIKNNLINHPEKYFLMNPMITLEKLRELQGKEYDLSFYIGTVIGNLINAHDYGTSREMCKQCKSKIPYSNYKNLDNRINSAEIGYMTLQIMKNELSPEIEGKYFEWLKNKLNKTKLSPQNISLGKNCEDFKEIKLDYILTDNLRNKLNTDYKTRA